MSVNYNNPQVLFQPKDKEKELVIAKKFQRKLILSKLISARIKLELKGYTESFDKFEYLL